ncbi:MAG: hydroxyacid dehydrogenase [Microscillaceae bacterium]|nr:hydroxyacid dehydrogenase [Microscillaceae bacterium]
MKYRILISAPYLLNEIWQFEHELHNKGIAFDVYPVKERLEEEDLLPIIDQYDGIICGDDRFSPRVLNQAASKLKVIVKWGTGIDSIDKVHAQLIGISVRNTLNAFTEPVSDSILAIVLAFNRQLIASDRIMKNGGWKKTFGLTMSEVVLGIIGLGNIGKAVARKAKAFGTKVIAHDILPMEQAILDELHVEMVSLPSLLQEADFVATCCDLNPSSYHLIDKSVLEIMKPSAIFINVARGPIVNEPDLVWALENKVIAGAGLDVFEEEPLPAHSPLRRMDNVLLSSHNVNASPLHWQKVHRNSLNMLYEVLGV